MIDAATIKDTTTETDTAAAVMNGTQDMIRPKMAMTTVPPATITAKPIATMLPNATSRMTTAARSPTASPKPVSGSRISR